MKVATRIHLDSFVDAEISDLPRETMVVAIVAALIDGDCFAASGTADFWTRCVVECLN